MKEIVEVEFKRTAGGNTVTIHVKDEFVIFSATKKELAAISRQLNKILKKNTKNGRQT